MLFRSTVAFLTNTTSRTRAEITGALRGAGFTVAPQEVFTAPAIGAAYLRAHFPGARVHLLNSGDVTADLLAPPAEGAAGTDPAGTDPAGTDPAGLTVAADGERPDVVVLGGAGPEFSYEALDAVFRHLTAGVPLVALHRNLYWRTDRGLQLDTGAFLHGLERAAGVRATVVGKPAPEFFTTALGALGVGPAEAVMVGDDVETDVLAAQAMGIGGVLVRTGKFTEAALRAAGGRPDHVIDSVADLPALLGISAAAGPSASGGASGGERGR